MSGRMNNSLGSIVIDTGVIATYALPFVRDCLDTPDPQFVTEKLIYLGIALAFFAAATALAVRLSEKRFEGQDLAL